MSARTSTRNFGSGSRQNHDASDFYSRFPVPQISESTEIHVITELLSPHIVEGDSRDMNVVPSNSVGLVVTSPPYFVGKEYELHAQNQTAPETYIEYLDMLAAVFSECVRVLEPGGRIAVNVANLGRKPYRSLACDVVAILQDNLGLLLRGEIVWRKSAGASGSCAWGSWCSPSNPVLRDTTERVIIASKGRFDRAKTVAQRASEGLPHKPTISKDEFLAATLDVWELPAESATRIGHPAPFPVSLPERLIELYTFENDWVLDPFMGSGSSLLAAQNTKRRSIGYEVKSEYVDLAKCRLNS